MKVTSAADRPIARGPADWFTGEDYLATPAGEEAARVYMHALTAI